MFEPQPLPGMVPGLSDKTEDTEFQMPSQKKQIDTPLAPSTAVSLGGTSAAPAAAPTVTTPAPSGDDDGPKAIDYTNTDPEYWREIASSGRASEVWIPNLEKEGGAEETAAAAKRFISGTVGTNWGTTAQSTAAKKAINVATRSRGTGAIHGSAQQARSVAPERKTPQKATISARRSRVPDPYAFASDR